MKKLTALTLMGTLLSFAHYSFAGAAVPAGADGTITFSGRITDQTCRINSESVNMNVGLPAVSRGNLNAIGKTAGETIFAIKLTNCKVSSNSTARLYFLPDPARVDANGILKNTTSDSPAKNVGIQLTTMNSEVIPLGAEITEYVQMADKVNLSTPNVVLNYKARYYATGPTTAGNVNASVQYNVIYD